MSINKTQCESRAGDLNRPADMIDLSHRCKMEKVNSGLVVEDRYIEHMSCCTLRH